MYASLRAETTTLKTRNLVFDISCKEGIRKGAFLFGESQSRIIVSVSADKQSELVSALVLYNSKTLERQLMVISKLKMKAGNQLLIL